MAGERLETRVDGIKLVWTRCCCGVKCYASRDRQPDKQEFVGEFEFMETIEKTVEHCRLTALAKAREVLL